MSITNYDIEITDEPLECFNENDIVITVQNGNYFVDGVMKKSLQFVKGKTYKFNLQDASVQNHPFRLSTVSDGRPSSYSDLSIYSDGVTLTPDGLLFTVPLDAPPILYYFCTVHPGMGSTISIKSINIVGSATMSFCQTFDSNADKKVLQLIVAGILSPHLGSLYSIHVHFKDIPTFNWDVVWSGLLSVSDRIFVLPKVSSFSFCAQSSTLEIRFSTRGLFTMTSPSPFRLQAEFLVTE